MSPHCINILQFEIEHIFSPATILHLLSPLEMAYGTMRCWKFYFEYLRNWKPTAKSLTKRKVVAHLADLAREAFALMDARRGTVTHRATTRCATVPRRAAMN